MNDQDLYELMRHEADHAPLGDGQDVRRGRARLRRHRVITGGTGVAGVALAAALVGGYASFDGGHDTPTGPSGGQAGHNTEEDWRDNTANARRSINAIAAVVKEHTRFEDFGQDVSPRTDFSADDDGRFDSTWWANDWREDGGVGLLQLTVDRGDPTQTSPSDSCAEIETTRIGTAWPASYDLCGPRTVDGRTALVGVERRPDRVWMVAKYLRSDGTLVELAFSSPAPESSADPILEPSLPSDELVMVATDPRVRLYDAPPDD